MKSVQICFLLILIPIVRGNFNVIQCYVCDDCDVFDDCLLQSCPQITISTTSSTTTKQTTLVPETSSTMPTHTPTSSPIIPSPPPLTSSITPSTTSVATTISDATWTTSEPTSISTEILETSDTAAAEDSTTTKVSFSTTSETAEQTMGKPTLQPQQSTENVVNGLETAFSYKSVPLHWQVFSYHCYSIDIVEKNKNKKRRGCVKVPVNKSGCTVLKDEFGCSAKNCRLCSFDRCNSCRLLKYSMPALMMCVVIGFIFK